MPLGCVERIFMINKRNGYIKTNCFDIAIFEGVRKIVQNGQTEQKQGFTCFWLPKGVRRNSRYIPEFSA